MAFNIVFYDFNLNNILCDCDNYALKSYKKNYNYSDLPRDEFPSNKNYTKLWQTF